MSLSTHEAEELCAKLFLRDGGAAVARLIEAHQDRAGEIVAAWHARCAPSFGAHEALSERHFHDVCVPDLLDAGPHEGTAGADAVEAMVGRSSALELVREKIACVAPLDSPVLILGETGTGKELVARAIHRGGPRRARPFLAINCAALPRELIESELFGHRRGAFSGATSDGLGLFRAAAGGTLLLDEISEMVPDLQAKLLRVLQERAVRPVGAVAEVPIDVRILASSNRDPDEAMRSGRLRADLYYRISASTIALPPLRARQGDVPLLAEHFYRRQRGGAPPVRGFTPRAIELLQARPWPGNVRELMNVVEEAAAMARGAAIDDETLRRTGRFGAAAPAILDGGELPTRAAFERVLVARALAQTGGNKLRAARQLGISRTTLYAMIAKHGLG